MKTLFEHKFSIGEEVFAITDPLTDLIEPVTITDVVCYASTWDVWYKTEPYDMVKDEHCFHTEAEAEEYIRNNK